MEQDFEIHLKNIVRRWKREASDADKLIIFSPYITSTTAETVTSVVSNNACEIYTLFSSELFINQSSSVKTLIKLKKRGFRLYSLPSLHAKIVLIPGVFASIGSQNLTTRGSKNLEASVLFNGEKAINDVHVKTKSWILGREEITLEMLIEMEGHIKPHLASYRVILDNAEEIDNKIKSNQEIRNLLLQQMNAALESRKKKLKSLKESILKSSKAKKNVFGEVKKIEPRWDSYSDGTYSFVPSEPSNMTEWIVNDSKVTLLRANRYICLIEDTGKIGWARVVKTRLTYFASGVSRTEITRFGESECNVKYSAIWDMEDSSENNIIISIQPKYSNASIVCTSWFGLDALTISDMKVKGSKAKEDLAILRMMKWIETNNQEFVNLLLSGLLSPFKYQKKLLGVEANEFFGPVGERYRIGLATINRKPLLLAKHF